MTVEKRTTIQTNDILAAELECKRCHHRVVKTTGIWKSPTQNCPNCGASWSNSADTLRQLEEALFNLRRITPEKERENEVPFLIRLEINGNEKP